MHKGCSCRGLLVQRLTSSCRPAQPSRRWQMAACPAQQPSPAQPTCMTMPRYWLLRMKHLVLSFSTAAVASSWQFMMKLQMWGGARNRRTSAGRALQRRAQRQPPGSPRHRHELPDSFKCQRPAATAASSRASSPAPPRRLRA